MEYSFEGANNKKLNSIKEYLLKKYNKTLLVISGKDPLKENSSSAISGVIENIDDILSDILKENIFLKIYIVTQSGPAIFVAVDNDYLGIRSIVDNIENKNLFGNQVMMDVVYSV